MKPINITPPSARPPECTPYPSRPDLVAVIGLYADAFASAVPGKKQDAAHLSRVGKELTASLDRLYGRLQSLEAAYRPHRRRTIASCEQCWARAREMSKWLDDPHEAYSTAVREAEDAHAICTHPTPEGVKARAGQFWDDATQSDRRAASIPATPQQETDNG